MAGEMKRVPAGLVEHRSQVREHVERELARVVSGYAHGSERDKNCSR